MRVYLDEYQEFEPTSIAPPRYFTPYKHVYPRWDLAIKARLPELGDVVLAVMRDQPPGMGSLAVQDDSWFLLKGRTIVSLDLCDLTEVSPQTVLWTGLAAWKKHRIKDISDLLDQFSR
ncbi:MAG: hypothetical protein AB1500_06945 [Bacillota bacterium]